MARNADKKAAEAAAYWSNVLQILIAAVNVLYIVSILYTLKETEFDWYWGMFIWPVIYAWSENKIYGMLISEIGNGLTPNYSLDMFGVIMGSHFLSIFSDSWGTYVLYLVPLYLVYKFGGYALEYLKGKS